MTSDAPLGVVFDVDGVLRLATPRRQLRRLRAWMRNSTLDLRSVQGMPQLLRSVVDGRPGTPVFYLTALPIGLSRLVTGPLRRDGYPPGTALLVGRVVAGRETGSAAGRALRGAARVHLPESPAPVPGRAAGRAQHRDPRPPADPAGLGDGARRVARDLRLELMREHLDLDEDTHLLDPDRAAATVQERVAALDAWHAGGRRGPRPPGRLRSHTQGGQDGLPRRHRWITAPAYRSILEPDGRPLGMRLRRTY